VGVANKDSVLNRVGATSDEDKVGARGKTFFDRATAEERKIYMGGGTAFVTLGGKKNSRHKNKTKTREHLIKTKHV